MEQLPQQVEQSKDILCLASPSSVWHREASSVISSRERLPHQVRVVRFDIVDKKWSLQNEAFAVIWAGSVLDENRLEMKIDDRDQSAYACRSRGYCLQDTGNLKLCQRHANPTVDLVTAMDGVNAFLMATLLSIPHRRERRSAIRIIQTTQSRSH